MKKATEDIIMTVKVELDLYEVEYIFKGLKVIDQYNIFTAPLRHKIATELQPKVDKKEKQ